MKKSEFDKFVAKLLEKGFVYSPVKDGEMVLVKQIFKPGDMDWSGDIPLNSFKSIVLPAKQDMATYSKDVAKVINEKIKPIFILGLNILDLRALALFEQVFAKDYYFQKRRQSLHYIGLTNGIEDDLRKYKVFNKKYEEDVLEHLIFDVFVERQKSGNLILFSGSEKGQQLLEKSKIEDYENIEFAGFIPEHGPNPLIEQKKLAILNNPDHPLWDKLAKICLSCGKCSIHCPTCFCFDQKDKVEFDQVVKTRQWTTCFYPKFSEITGGNKELDSVKKKLYFWYYHKFVRIPDEFDYYGCVSCMRCYKTCPVEINIAENLQE
ncbi:4Fe-4S dicluster domain-containing protein, partial [Candidatus Falkowbacteria bacterium]|nr:4Fe-4S dicluster domain-containing protein [Candidatus Falkowbacteria bacterium]